MHAKSGLRVLLQWKIYRPDSVITAVIQLNHLQLNDSNKQNPYQSPAAIGNVSPPSPEKPAKNVASGKSLAIGLTTFTIAIATLFLSVLLIVAGVNPKFAGDVWMLCVMVVSGAGSVLGFLAAFSKGSTKWQLTTTMFFALIVNAIMMLSSLYCAGCFAFKMWQNNGNL